MNTGGKSAFLDCAVVELASERVIDIERNSYALTPEQLWQSAADDLPCPAGEGSAFGQCWSPAHQWPPWETGRGLSLRKNFIGSGACSSKNAAYFFLILGNSYNALTPCLAELRMTEDGLK